MSKNFEKEYKEYLNAQAPDLWDRIEAGVDAVERSTGVKQVAESEDMKKVVPISAKKSKKGQKKRRVRYQHYRMIASVAACLFALVIIVPVYLLTESEKKSESAADAVPQMVENVTIENLVVDASESEAAAEEAPMEESAEEMTEIDITTEALLKESVTVSEVTEQNGTGTTETEVTAVAGSGENADVAAEPELIGEDGIASDIQKEVGAGSQEEMTVTILGEGIPQEGGVMYAAAENGSESSATISLFVPEGSGIALTADGVYVLMVQMSPDGSYYEVLTVVE